MQGTVHSNSQMEQSQANERDSRITSGPFVKKLQSESFDKPFGDKVMTSPSKKSIIDQYALDFAEIDKNSELANENMTVVGNQAKNGLVDSLRKRKEEVYRDS